MKLYYYLNNILVKGQIYYSILLIDISILFILKKDKELRLYIDYRSLNIVIIKNKYLLSLIIKILDYLYSVKQFLKLDFKDIYYYIYIKYNNEQKIAFYIYYNYFKYFIILFKLANTPIIFQIYIN